MPPKNVINSGQIERMISLAYILSTRDEIAIDELEELFSVKADQVEEDLNQLMFCGLPPYSPDQLFDISIEDGFVSMFYNDVFIAPLKLNDSERTNATIALSRLREVSSIEEKILIDEILNIINATKKKIVDIEMSNENLDMFQKAIDDEKVISIIYLSLNSGSIDERKIEPKKIYTTPSSSYIHAFCQRDKVMKLFRTDRIVKAIFTLEKPLAKDFESDIDISDDSIPFVSSSESYIIFEVKENAKWLLDTYRVETVSKEESLYKFEISNPFVAARILLSTVEYVKYIEGTISKEEILGAINTIHSRVNT